MMTRNKWGIVLFILFLVTFRTLFGIHINFNHEDYTQIYLIGLEDAFSGNWSYWGPDVVWSKTRLPGALQGLLVGVPIQLTGNMYSPIILSNIIAATGLVMFAFYAKKRFPKLSIYFLLALLLLFPFGLFNGAVLLNTAYLIFAGSIFFISVFELFMYREKLLYKPAVYFFLIGFSFLITFQLHLTWVMFVPFILVLVYLDIKKVPKDWWKPLLFIFLGCLLSGLPFFPTLFKYGNVMMNNAEGNLLLDFGRIASSFDLLIRYIGIATFDITRRDEVKLALEKSTLVVISIWIIKIYTFAQFAGICISLFFVDKSKEFKRTMLLFLLTFIMALCMYIMSNKNLDIRTYILLFPLPIWLSFYAYNYLAKFRFVKVILNSSLVVLFVAMFGVGAMNYNEIYSFKAVEDKINRAIENEDPDEFGKRRSTIMDQYN